jgi:hypothetical protein
MGRIADKVRTMRGQSLAAIVAEVERMEAEQFAPIVIGFDEFWEAWPNKVGKPAARKAYKAAAKRHNGLDPFDTELMAGMQRYIAEKPVDRPWLNPATFLNQERWLDQPAPVYQPPKGADFFDAFGSFADERAGRGGGQPGDREALAGLAQHQIADHR